MIQTGFLHSNSGVNESTSAQECHSQSLERSQQRVALQKQETESMRRHRMKEVSNKALLRSPVAVEKDVQTDLRMHVVASDIRCRLIPATP